jgi:hypothetical protein
LADAHLDARFWRRVCGRKHGATVAPGGSGRPCASADEPGTVTEPCPRRRSSASGVHEPTVAGN